MDEYMGDFLDFSGFGPAIARREVPAEKIERFRGKLLDKLLAYWRDYGWCGYAKGLFWTVDPDEWEDALEAWIGDTPVMARDSYYVIARSAFGKLVLWGTHTGCSLKIDTASGLVFPVFDGKEFRQDGPDLSLQLFFASTSRAAYDLKDLNDKPLFEQALSRLGPLDHGTLYGFVPALALGGEPSVERLQVLDARTHLSILSRTTELRVLTDLAHAARG